MDAKASQDLASLESDDTVTAHQHNASLIAAQLPQPYPTLAPYQADALQVPQPTTDYNSFFTKESWGENSRFELPISPHMGDSIVNIYGPSSTEAVDQLYDDSLNTQTTEIPSEMVTVILAAVEAATNGEKSFFSDSPLTDIAAEDEVPDIPAPSITPPVPSLDSILSAMDIPETSGCTEMQSSNGGPSAFSLFDTSFEPSDHRSPERISLQLESAAENPPEVPSNASPNINGKRPLQEEVTSGRGRTKRKKGGAATVPVYSGFNMPIHIPMHISINDGIDAAEVPIDAAFFAAALASEVHFPPFQPGQTPAYQAEDPLQPNDGNQVAASKPDPLKPELQVGRCLANRYKYDQFPRCVACIRKWAGDTCRFQGVRFLLKDSGKRVQGITFVDYQQPESPILKFPYEWNVPLTPESIRRLKYSVAKGLLPLLKDELKHVRLPDIIRRPRETDVRITCDTCLTSIFSCAWMCRICGREACSECIKQVKGLTFPNRAVNDKGEKKMHTNHTFLSCFKRAEHSFKDFSPVTRFCVEELNVEVEEMEQFLAKYGEQFTDTPPSMDTDWDNSDYIDPLLRPIMRIETSSSPKSIPPQDPELATPSLGDVLDTPRPIALTLPRDERYFSVALPDLVTGRVGDPPDLAGIPFATYHIFNGSISDDQFRAAWARGRPLVVTKLLNNFKIDWTPEFFIHHYGTIQCLILECHTNENKCISVGEFFAQFGQQAGRDNKSWKLKDWPPSADFKHAFPDLYVDFLGAVPVPNYTRRDGSLNIAAHFPENSLPPDLGPKMYNALASSEQPGKKGSTRLHMDMADAVNIMLYSGPPTDGKEGVAAWDIYKAEDAPKIRQFLKKQFKEEVVNDPIHSQMFYLDIELRKKLYDEHGVIGWRIYQKPGDAVFIPAGCAHQVVNLADCIKVACDFVSPDNVERCSTLTREFREQNQAKTWKEDILQLSSMMWFCWLNLRRIESKIVV